MSDRILSYLPIAVELRIGRVWTGTVLEDYAWERHSAQLWADATEGPHV